MRVRRSIANSECCGTWMAHRCQRTATNGSRVGCDRLPADVRGTHGQIHRGCAFRARRVNAKTGNRSTGIPRRLRCRSPLASNLAQRGSNRGPLRLPEAASPLIPSQGPGEACATTHHLKTWHTQRPVSRSFRLPVNALCPCLRGSFCNDSVKNVPEFFDAVRFGNTFDKAEFPGVGHRGVI